MSALTHESHLKPSTPPRTRRQRTLCKTVSYSGTGVHTGVDVSMDFVPAKEGTGIVFRRTDLQGNPEIPATVEYVQNTNRSTTIGVGDVHVKTVEHVLAALRAYQVDNLYIDLNAEEPPVGNGSSDIFVQLIEDAGIEEEEGHLIRTVQLQEPVYFSDGDIHLVALPDDCFRISYTLSYPQSEVLKAQYFSTVITAQNFKEQIGPCRTFSLYEEVSPLMDKGLIKGGSLNNAVVIKNDVVFSKEGLVFPDEMVRHKILDIVGDLSLVGFEFHAHIIGIRSGHGANLAFAKKLYRNLIQEKH